jgi:hypothetical protein
MPHRHLDICHDVRTLHRTLYVPLKRSVMEQEERTRFSIASNRLRYDVAHVRAVDFALGFIRSLHVYDLHVLV